MTTDTGGSAYPNNNSDGMSWLDACAMKAMQAMIGKGMLRKDNVFKRFSRFIFGEGVEVWWDTPNESNVAARAYEHATAMLAEKRRREGGQA